MPDGSQHFTLAAIGRAGRFEIQIDETIKQPSEFEMEITTPELSFRFSLSTRLDVAHINSFLSQHAGKSTFSQCTIGSFLGAPVLLIKDNEFADRFWVRASQAGQMIDFTLAGNDLVEFSDALAQTADQLKS